MTVQGLRSPCETLAMRTRRSQTVAYIPDRLLPLDEKNKLISLSSALEGPNFAGIAYRPDTGNFMAVQEHVPHNSTRWGSASLWLRYTLWQNP